MVQAPATLCGGDDHMGDHCQRHSAPWTKECRMSQMNQMDLSVCSCFLFLCFLMFFVNVFISQCDLGVLYVCHWTLKTTWFCPSQDGYSNGSWIFGLERLVLVRVDFYQFAECGSWTSVDDDGLSAILLWTPGTAPLETLHPSCHFVTVEGCQCTKFAWCICCIML